MARNYVILQDIKPHMYLHKQCANNWKTDGIVNLNNFQLEFMIALSNC